MQPGWRSALVAAAVAMTLVVPAAAPAAPAGLVSLPHGVPPAATRSAPELPAPAPWPFGEEFPRTSGTGRYHGGAFFWSDFIYDDHGAGVTPTVIESAGAPPFGAFSYPSGERYAANGADIFRLGIGLTGTDTWWRVDWSSLVAADVPALAFGVDADGSAATGASEWGANTGVSVAGTDHVLLVTGSGAWWSTGGVVTSIADLGGQHVIDLSSRSFLVRVPRAVFDPSAPSVVRAVAGLADQTGTAFATVGVENGQLPGQPNVFNVGFRSFEVERSAPFNFWMDNAQAQALFAGDISEFAVTLDWSRLAAGASEPELRPTGVSNRWYVSKLELGQGRAPGAQSTADGQPTYLGRVQPYSVFVPSTYDGTQPTPLTWVLHSLAVNHNQYAATAPELLAALCEARGSVCVTTLGRGPDGSYRGPAELDFWEVWRDLASTDLLDPDRTVIGGYSMGGFGTIHLASQHPDLFAAAFLIASAARGGGAVGMDRIDSFRWIPYYHAHGALDELVPVTDALDTVEAFDQRGYRYRFDLHPTADHVVWSVSDSFGQVAAWLDEIDPVRVHNPAFITYAFDGATTDEALGLGAQGAYWVRDVVADGAARVFARSQALEYRPPVPVRLPEVRLDEPPFPAVRQELRWELDDAEPRAAVVTLNLDGISAATVQVDRAGLLGEVGELVQLELDQPLDLTVAGWPAGTVVELDGELVGMVSSTISVLVPAGRHQLAVVGLGMPDRGDTHPPTPATGGGAGAVALALLAAAMFFSTRPWRSA